MARRRRSSSGFIFFLFFLVIIGAVGGYIFFFTDYIKLTPSTKQTVKEEMDDSSVFPQASKWLPEVVWTKPSSATIQTYYGKVRGVQITGKLVNRDGYIEHPEDPGFLKKLGFNEDLNLAADGPGSSSWGYLKNIGDEQQIVVFSYANEDMHPSNEGPLTASCPCTLNLAIFVSEPFKPNWDE